MSDDSSDSSEGEMPVILGTDYAPDLDSTVWRLGWLLRKMRGRKKEGRKNKALMETLENELTDNVIKIKNQLKSQTETIQRLRAKLRVEATSRLPTFQEGKDFDVTPSGGAREAAESETKTKETQRATKRAESHLVAAKAKQQRLLDKLIQKNHAIGKLQKALKTCREKNMKLKAALKVRKSQVKPVKGGAQRKKPRSIPRPRVSRVVDQSVATKTQQPRKITPTQSTKKRAECSTSSQNVTDNALHDSIGDPRLLVAARNGDDELLELKAKTKTQADEIEALERHVAEKDEEIRFLWRKVNTLIK